MAVIGYEFWDRRFGRDPAVIGKVIRIEGTPFTIVGVSRKWFMGMTPGTPPGIAIPLTAGPFAVLTPNRSSLWIFITGRLRDGVTIEQARAQLRSFWQIGEATCFRPWPQSCDHSVTSADVRLKASAKNDAVTSNKRVLSGLTRRTNR